MKYIPYHVHSIYSVWDALLEIPEYIDWAKENNLPALSLTDHGNMCGVFDFVNACRTANINPVVGNEFYLDDKPDSRENYHIILIAKNYDGYKNLVALNNRAQKDNFYYKARLKNEWLLEKKIDNIIISTACVRNEIAKLVTRGFSNNAMDLLKKYHRVYGDDFYLEIQFNEMKDQHIVNAFYLDAAQELGIQTVIGLDAHYKTPQDHEIQDILHRIQGMSTKSKKDKEGDDEEINYFECKNLSLKSLDDIVNVITKQKYNITKQQFLDAVRGSWVIAEKCDIVFDKTLKYPRVKVQDVDAEFLQYCQKGLLEKYKKGSLDPANHQFYVEKIKLEYGVLKRERYIPLFVIMADLIERAKKENVLVGPGRGSVIGSFCSYLMGISCIDPIKYDLYFERFCPLESGGRVTSPDIDVDFTDRDKVIEIIENLYGKEHVLSVSNFNMYKMKSTFVDLMRLRDIDRSVIFNISKKMDDKLSYEENLENPIVKKASKNYPEEFALLKRLARKIRSVGKHASAIIILPEGHELPLFKKSDTYCTQNNGKILDKMGFLKLDILNIDYLKVIQDTIELAGIDLDIYNMNLDDPAILADFHSGFTVGVFQSEEMHTINVLRNVEIKKFEDIANVISIIRPGLDKETFTKNCNNLEKISYLRGLEPILSKTYGVLLYQEQVMQICRDIGGFSLSESDGVRRSIAKKTGDMDIHKAKFIEGAMLKDYDFELASKIWNMIAACEDYIFNKSHACGYAYVAYLCMYLKHYHPKEYMTCCLRHKNDKKFFYECRRLNVRVELPTLNKSGVETELKDGVIYIGLSAIKGVNMAAKIIVDNGPYNTLSEFVARNPVRNVSKDIVEVMGRIGVFDYFEPNRRLAETKLMEAFTLKKKKKLTVEKQGNLFGDKEIYGDIFDHMPESKRMFEYEFVGYSNMPTPIDEVQELLNQKSIRRLDLGFAGTGMVVGQIVERVNKQTKKGKNFAIITLEDNGIQINFIVWSEDLERYEEYLQVSYFIVCRIEKQENFDTSTLVQGDGIVKVMMLSDFIEKNSVGK